MPKPKSTADWAAEVRALTARLDAARAAYLAGDWDGLEAALGIGDTPKDGPTVAVSDLHRAATADPTPQTDTDTLVKRTRDRMRRDGIPIGTDNPDLLAAGAQPLDPDKADHRAARPNYAQAHNVCGRPDCGRTVYYVDGRWWHDANDPTPQTDNPKETTP